MSTNKNKVEMEKETAQMDEQQENKANEQENKSDQANKANEHENLTGEHGNGSDGNEYNPREEGDTAAASDEVDIVSDLQRQAEDNQNRYLRAQADFDNFRRRTLKEKEELKQYASHKVINDLLPVLDNFQRALQTGSETTDTAAFAKGVDMIYRQFFQVMENEGLKPMNPVGQPFDPELHQAIMQAPSDEYETGIVTEVIQEGYLLKDKVIRPAMVKVSE